MASLLIAIIYLAFISLGLPDSLLGAGWPVMQAYFGVPLSYAGIVSMIIAGCTIISSLLSDRLTAKFGAGLVTAVSVFVTAASLFGFSVSSSFIMLCVFAVPYGFGGGAIDAALNNYVALHYTSRHMNWLHCFWGVGAAVSPYIMSYALGANMGWQGGYRGVSYIQIGITLLMFLSLPMWKKRTSEREKEGGRAVLSLRQILRIRGIKYVLIAFFAYCSMEATAMLWSSSFLVNKRGISVEIAAKYASLFFIGITVGRFLSGIISNKIGDKNMIRIGFGVMTVGIIAVWLPVSADWLCLNGLIVIGLGCAPVYPAIIHSTPANFGEENSQAIIGVQMASAYTGSTFMPPIFGLIANYIDISAYPLFLSVFALLMLFMTEKLNRI